MNQLKALLANLADTFAQLRDGYESSTTFSRMRIWVLGVLGLDLIFTLSFVLIAGRRSVELAVWFEPAFPSNILVLKNESRKHIANATVMLDGQYFLTVETVEPGVNGYEVNRAFHDAADRAPPQNYVPQMVDITIDGNTYRMPVESREAKNK